jgi:hypothetical protein
MGFPGNNDDPVQSAGAIIVILILAISFILDVACSNDRQAQYNREQEIIEATQRFNVACYSPDLTYTNIKLTHKPTHYGYADNWKTEFFLENGTKVILPPYYAKNRCIFIEAQK